MPRPRTVSDDDVLDGVLALAPRVGPAKLTLAAAAREVGLSPATLIQRYGTKHELLLAADRRGVELWVTPVEEAEHPRHWTGSSRAWSAPSTRTWPRKRWPTRWPCCSSISSNPTSTRRRCAGAAAARGPQRHLLAASNAGELRDGIDIAALANLVETTYHGAMIGWALHREGSLPAWMRQQIEAVLAPLRGLARMERGRKDDEGSARFSACLPLAGRHR